MLLSQRVTVNKAPAMRKAVYTFIIGAYDDLKPPAVVTKGWDYICFTDDPELRSEHWDVRLSVRPPSEQTLDNKRFAMKHMILFHNFLWGYDMSLSVGGQTLINCDLDELVAQHFGRDEDMMICRHPERDCVYDEAEACKRYEKDDPAVIDQHMLRYRREGYPTHYGLYSTRVIARRHHRPVLERMCEQWFAELLGGSRRDQLSLNYAIWRTGPLRISTVDANTLCHTEERFIVGPHRPKGCERST